MQGASESSSSEQFKRVRAEIKKYISLHDKLSLGARPDPAVKAGAQKVPRRNGKAPMGWGAHQWMDDPDNQDAARKIEPAIREMRGSGRRSKTHRGISLYYCVCTAGYGGAWEVDFAEMRRWEDGLTQDARDHMAAYEAALDLLTRVVIWRCRQIGISPEMVVNTRGADGKSDEQVSPNPDSSQGTVAREAYRTDWRYTVEDAYRELADTVHERVENGMALSKAVAAVSEEMTERAKRKDPDNYKKVPQIRIWRALARMSLNETENAS